jgi:hypothetical protein
VEEMIISPFLIPVLAIVGSFVYVIVKTLAHSRVRELEIRERIAMIERGLVPPPEVDPKGFERAMGRLDRHEMLSAHRGYSSYGGRHRRAGVTLMGIGFGLMVLITFAGESPSNAVGVGGFLVVMGVAFFVNSLIDTRTETPTSPQSSNPSTPNATPLEQPRRD